MKMECKRWEIVITAENDIDRAYLEEVLNIYDAPRQRPIVKTFSDPISGNTTGIEILPREEK